MIYIIEVRCGGSIHLSCHDDRFADISAGRVGPRLGLAQALDIGSSTARTSPARSEHTSGSGSRKIPLREHAGWIPHTGVLFMCNSSSMGDAGTARIRRKQRRPPGV